MERSRVTDAVVSAANRRDPDAIRIVYEELSGRVLGYLRAKGVADADAEDLTSEVFVSVIGLLGRITGGADGLSRVVFSIAHARMADYYRGRGRRPETEPYDSADDPRQTASPEESVTERMSSQQVLAVLRTLPDDHREVLALRFVADLSIEQTAAVIQRSPGAVKQLQRRALLVVRQEVEGSAVTR